jgi:hypothetical protein
MSYKETRTTFSKRDSECHACKKQIKKGQECIIDPKKKEVSCLKCGKDKEK